MPFEIKSEIDKPSYTIVPKKFRNTKRAAKYLAAVAAVASLTACPGALSGVPPITGGPQIAGSIPKDSAVALVDSLFAVHGFSAIENDAQLTLSDTISGSAPFEVTYQADGYDSLHNFSYELVEYTSLYNGVVDSTETSVDVLDVSEVAFLETNNWEIDGHMVFAILGNDSATVVDYTLDVITQHLATVPE